MVNSRVRQILFGRIVLEFLQIDIPSRLELAAAGTETEKNTIKSPLRFHFIITLQHCQAMKRVEFSAPSIELSGIAVITEYRRHAFGAANVTDGGSVSSYVIQRILHRQLRVSFQNLRLGAAAVISQEIGSDKFVVKSLESVRKR